ncbi:hypothetical protein O3M35_000579 [Rhynocoris fuscipes]|uniref:PCI domain-containing protein n=1 Tax=Rhynocoris fuscipes TaxID=488301 RepID=A0AAW1DT25_9HEMI
MEYDEQDNFEYGEESNNSEAEADADLENQYYHSKLAKDYSLPNALDCFQKVLELQGDQKGEWGFKALKQIIKILFKKEDFTIMLDRYKELLTYMSTVTRNQSEKAVTGILNYISLSKNTDLLCLIYEITIEKLKELKNDRLWFKINTRLGKLYYELGEYDKLESIIKQLNSYITNQGCKDDEDMSQKGSQLLDMYSLEIQLYSAQNNYTKMRQIYEKSLSIKCSLPNPLTLDFYEAFKNYDEAGNSKRSTCLKYLILTTMLAKSKINPLDSQDTRQYHNNDEVKPIAQIYYAYRDKDLNKFELILNNTEKSIYSDPIVRDSIDNIRKNIRIAVLLDTIKPYKSIRIPFISEMLNINDEETEELLVCCILDNLIHGKIDQINKILILNEKEIELTPRYKAIVNLTRSIDRLHASVCNDII